MRQELGIDDYWGRLVHDFNEGNALVRHARSSVRHELIGAQICLTKTHHNFLYNPSRIMSPMYAAGELFWYLSGTGNGDQICSYAPSYTRFLGRFNSAYGAYGPRLMSQFWTAVELLRADPGSCRCYIPIFEPADLCQAHPDKDEKDIPCTTGVSLFLNLRGELIFFAQMRSNDIWLGLPYDVYCWSSIGHLFAEALGTTLDAYIHQASSLHVYENNIPKFLQSGFVPDVETLSRDYKPHPDTITVLIPEAVAVEEQMRLEAKENGSLNFEELEGRIVDQFGVDTILGRNLMLCALNFYSELSDSDINRLSEFIPPAQLLNAQHLLAKRKIKNASNN